MGKPGSPRDGTEGYAEEARLLASQMESMSFRQVHKGILHLLPHPPAQALDLGAGTGRDAEGLASLGFEVVAVEPVPQLREAAGRASDSEHLRWVDDRLPHLNRLRVLYPRPSFDIVLVSAVWMHLNEDDRRTAVPIVSRLLRPGGILVLTVRHGPIPEGRHVFSVPDPETTGLAVAAGLEILHHSRVADLLGRPEFTWSVMAFRSPR